MHTTTAKRWPNNREEKNKKLLPPSVMQVRGRSVFYFIFHLVFCLAFLALKKKKKLMKDEILLETQDSDFLSIIYGEW